jgi:O-acetyl-ADP-ribose deacetylase
MTPQPETINGLLTFLPLLQNTSPDFSRIGYWGDMSSRVSTATARDLFQYLHNKGFVLKDFDWEAWSDQAVSYLENRKKLQQADMPTLYKIITTHLQADRYVEGHYDAIIENGFLADVLARMQEIIEQ